MKNQKKAVRILALVMAALLLLSLIVSVIPIRSHADYDGGIRAEYSVSGSMPGLMNDISLADIG